VGARGHDVSTSLGATGSSPRCPFLLLAALWSPSRISGLPALSEDPLGLPDELVGEEDEAVTNGLGIDKAHGLLVAGLAEEALAGPEHDREDDQPQLVDQIMLD
jgi:hypothetical protein